MQLLNPWQQNAISGIIDNLGENKEPSSKTAKYAGF
jgi:hypothetical protein